MTSKDLLLLPLPILTLILVPRSRLWNHFVEFFFSFHHHKGDGDIPLLTNRK
ncbi:hypothetical protein PanWU01x14_004650, partial [Parasponia andersonii]